MYTISHKSTCQVTIIHVYTYLYLLRKQQNKFKKVQFLVNIMWGAVHMLCVTVYILTTLTCLHVTSSMSSSQQSHAPAPPAIRICVCDCPAIAEHRRVAACDHFPLGLSGPWVPSFSQCYIMVTDIIVTSTAKHSKTSATDMREPVYNTCSWSSIITH